MVCVMSSRRFLISNLRRKLIISGNVRFCSTHHSENLNATRVFSGIQPTGTPHIGNYLGALKSWVELQKASNVVYCIVDLHSLTIAQEPQTLREKIRAMATCLLACGLDPERSIIFEQSSVSQHCELAWILSCLVTLPQLAHLPQWREKSQRLVNPGLGLYTYPVLQSADILLYKATHVPVGDDQIEHIELTRHLARTFNKRYDNVFPLPQAVLTSAKRIQSLRNPGQKMSKSEENPLSRIDIIDSADDIRTKIRKSVTDVLGSLTYDPVLRPGVSNLINIHANFTGLAPEVICDENSARNLSDYKNHLADIVVEALKPIREEFLRLKENPSYVDDVLTNGADRARAIASTNMATVKRLVGLS